MAQKFYTDGMTVDEILALGDDVLRHMSKRDVSRALRTVSLAANKRVNRLLNHAVLENNKYVEKSGKKAIALDALNKLNEESGGDLKFGVKNKTRNQMIAELGRAKDFMALKTSTVGKALEVRQAREKRAMGQTREEYIKDVEKKFKDSYKQETGKRPTKEQVKEVVSKDFLEYKKTEKTIWSNYRMWQETYGHKGKFQGSDVVINEVANRTASGMAQEDVFTKANEAYEQEYIRQQEEQNDLVDEALENLDLGGY